MSIPSTLSGTELLNILRIENGVLIYAKRMASKHWAVGDAVRVVNGPNGKPYYSIAGCLYKPPRLLRAIQRGDPTEIDAPVNHKATRDAVKLSTRDMDIYAQLKEGGVYADVGAQYGISRQRVKQIVDKLAANGLTVATLEQRRKARLSAFATARASKYGANPEEVTSNPDLYAALRIRITHKRNHARARGIPFDLTVSDLHPLPSHCPALGIPLSYDSNVGAADNAMSIDRIAPEIGYIKGNVVLVSQRANRIKNDATVEELRKLYEFYSGLEAANKENPT